MSAVHSSATPHRQRRPGESVEAYRVAMGWDAPLQVTANGCAIFEGGEVIARASTPAVAKRLVVACEQHEALTEALTFAIRFFDQLTPADVERMRALLQKATGRVS